LIGRQRGAIGKRSAVIGVSQKFGQRGTLELGKVDCRHGRDIAMPARLDEPERIFAAAIERHARGDVAALAPAILNELWEAGYDVTCRHDAAVSHYSEADEQQAVAARVWERPGDLCGRMADEPRNEPIRDQINEIARKFDDIPTKGPRP
jgi:hypothetical protein